MSIPILPDRELYRTIHRCISVEVSRHWTTDYRTEQRKEVWCFYLSLAVEQFPKKHHRDLWQPVKYTDYGTPMQPYSKVLSDLDWHCGMTYYEKTYREPFKGIKAGCDYNHLWDENRYYSARGVMDDAKRCVDSLWLCFPELKTLDQLWEEHRAPYKAKVEATT